MGKMGMLGLLAGAAMMLAGFVTAPSALAEKEGFTAGASGKALSETTLKNHVFTTTGSEAKCEAIAFTGTTPATSYKEQTVSPSYEGCTAFGFKATVDTNGCNLTFSSTTGEAKMAAVNLTGCGGGTEADKTKGIQVTTKIPFVAECIVDIPEQSMASAASYANGANDIKIKFTASKMMSDITVSSGLCPLSTGTHTDGTYDGESTVQASGTSVTWGDEKPIETFTADIVTALSTTTLSSHIFTFTQREFVCSTVDFVGSTVAASYKEQTVSPSIQGCFAFGEFGMETNGCEFIFQAATDEKAMAAVSISGCGSGSAEDKTKGIRLNVPAFGSKCVVDIPEQTIPSAVSYANGSEDIVIKITMTKIMFDVTTSGAFCSLTAGTHSGANGAEYRGEVTVAASGGSLTWSGV